MKLSQIRTALSRPDISYEYLQWQISKAANGGNARFKLPNGALVSNFANFSEFHSMMNCLSPAEHRFFADIPPGDSPIIDVGANVGVVSLLLAMHFRARQIHAFEPAPTTFDTLKKNVALNGLSNIACHQAALSDSVGEIAFDADPFCRGNARIAGVPNANLKMVPTTTLDAFVAAEGIRSIGLLKIDVEGFETTVLRGAAQTLRDQVPALIFMEVVPDATRSAGFDAADPIRLVTEAGYAWFRLEDNGGMSPVSEADLDGLEYENWIARPA
jgi:FkbM family methyltransferase